MSRRSRSNATHTYIVELGERSYPVYVGLSLIENIGSLIRDHLDSVEMCAVVTSELIWETHGNTLHNSLKNAGIKVMKVLVPDGEEAKSWPAAGKLIGELLEQGMDRKSAIIAFGGGAVGDLAGFVASIYLRGVRIIQVPTTLLSQVDSSIGGKTAVNHPLGKNLIGSFYQPSLVVSDQTLLRTLPRGEILSGLVETVKHGVIADQTLFKFIEDNVDSLVEADPESLAYVVERSVSIKGDLVTLDERDDKGVRAILNYGHTTGHALEILSDLEIRHGEAVAMGMIVASRISERLELISRRDTETQRRLLEELGLRLDPLRLEPSKIVEIMHRDKKSEGGSIRFVLPTGIGSSPVLRQVSEQLITHTLEEEGYG